MLKEILDAGGKQLFIPVIVVLLTAYAVKSLFGLQKWRSQHRKEFLEIWQNTNAKDDIWIEVAIRHLCGSYLPAHVIRKVLTLPSQAITLFDLVELWSLLEVEHLTGNIRWKRPAYAIARKRRLIRILLFLGYFVFASTALVTFLVVAKMDHTQVMTWFIGTLAIGLGTLAFICLVHDDAFKKANEIESELLDWLNSD